MTEGRIRLHRDDRIRLKKLKRHPEVKEALGEQKPSYEDVLQLIYPDEVNEDTIIERPESDMVVVELGPAYALTHQLAGENVATHRVVNHYISEFVDREEIDFSEADYE